MATQAPLSGATGTPARVTVFTSTKTLTKIFHLDPRTQTLQKISGGMMYAGEYATYSVACVADLYALIQTLNSKQALGLGVADKPAGRITTTKKQNGDAIARTKENFKARAGAGFLLVDLDHHESNPYKSAEGAYQYLIEHVPQLAAAQALAITSSSSHVISADGVTLQGFRGCHVYFLISDARDLQRATKTLFDRLQLQATNDNGAIRYDIAKNGALLLRGRIDASVGSPERLIFAGGARCLDGLTQRREKHLFNQSAEPLDTINALPDLSKEEAESLDKLRADAKSAARPAQLAVIERQPFIRNLPESERAAAVSDYITRLDRGYLPLDTVLYFSDGTEITARGVLDAPHLYAGKRLRDPAEPLYADDKRIAVLYVSDDHVYIYSHAHGGQKWTIAEECHAFDIYNLPRVTITTQAISKQLAGAGTELEQAAIIWAYILKRAKTVEVVARPSVTVDALASHAQHVTPAIADAIKSRLIRWLAVRAKDALSAVRPSAAALARHNVQHVESLDQIKYPVGYKGVYLVQAPMGAGKTQLVGAPFAAWAKSKFGRFVAITPRMALTRELAQRLSLTNYQDIDADAAQAISGAAICLPSITAARLRTLARGARYLFIDEITQVLRFIESRECRTSDGTNADVYTMLRYMIKNAECIIGADASLDDKTIAFIEECRPGERFNIVQMTPRGGLRADFISGEKADARALGEISARLMGGQRLWIACESKAKTLQIERTINTIYPAIKTLALTSDNKGDEQQSAFWENPELESLKYDVVIHSPVISSGLSIEHKTHGAHFDHVFYFGAGYVSTPADAAQMMRRVRYIASATVVLGVNNTNAITDRDNYLDALENAAELNNGELAAASLFDSFCAAIRTDENRARSDFCAGLWWVLQAAGYVTTCSVSGDETADGIAMTAARIDLRAETVTALLTAENIDDLAAQNLEKKDARTSAETILLTRHRVQKAFGINDLTPELIAFYDDGRGIRRLDRYLAARGWYASHDDDGTHLTRRAFGLARVRAYQILNGAKRLADGARFTKEDAQALLDAVTPHRFALAFLGVIPAKFAAEAVPACAQPLRELAAIVAAMGGETETAKREGVRDLVLKFMHLEEVAELRRHAARMVIADFAEPEQPTQPTRKQQKRDEQRAQARALVAGGYSLREVAAALGVSYWKARDLVASDS